MKFILFLLLLISGANAFAQTSVNAYPFKPEEDKRFRKLEQRTVAKYFYDFKIAGGAIGTVTLKPYYSGGQLPINAIIYRTYMVANTAVTPGAATIALACGSASILGATTITTSGLTAQYAAYDGLQTGTSAASSNVGTSACTPTMTISVSAITAGRIDLWVEYIIPTDINGR